MDNISPDPTVVLSGQPTQDIPRDNNSMMKKIIPIMGIILIVVLIGSGGYILGINTKNAANAPTPTITNIKGCTQEAKICPDGTSVGRTGPNCEFAPCPSVFPTTSTVPSTVPSFFVCPTVSDWCPDGSRKLRIPPTCDIVPCPTLTPYPTTNITPVIANSNLNNWKTYTGTKPLLQKISFKYPDNWYVWDYDNQVWAENLPKEQYNNPNEVYEGGMDSVRIKGSQFSIAVQINSSHKNLEEYLKGPFTGGCQGTNSSKVVVDGEQAIMYSPDHTQCKTNMYATYVAKGDYIYIIMIESADNQLNILQKIVSTIKFL